MLLVLTGLVLPLADKTPSANDVKAGWGAFGLFLMLGLAVVLLGISLTRHLKKAQRNADAGVFGPPDESAEGPERPER